ncbi:glycerol-3-phosphate ABC transporter ATP-binding protein [Candidatus Desantisbacteria bacterium CG_4_10_14_0_8_um_filter_48_22]|uniref:Glycerol-3-phosphate ABC transporter ATP-binding protein n=1 Tax=Candidatus Desantisbacteria bacterium CG_4_10_14_0_8_um_filter_48_22 TaxID=1974543 RepID=A0A2M7SDH7_9BACT|nr:MAG: glycerol-3-phosphate ABC transporter ATP-binding protein [Candidatus Desantisbacteria bacterium CG1_02_49_89]PIV54287.1 MAG: glycerol-3-phosphate ABC transporter ATP-binding protein [Candidatus Desantisbacteria bacterium CG02_land_8_20_14_3_00_49_13]PIZ17568.1 MAG: glycerol-3-phosphate ABC transporter ATP-binding protein [Candidatus Desantisbacteria bacterium CG_4_10_14_0_8_um_filter_48_22]PJB27408.1 MAG: glycerol-3-phosphate ABC transporter ATP-binding protein [Candidatus Desantisbacter
MAGVIFRNVTKVFGKDVKAVNDVSFRVEDKEFMVLVGPSGCGKSTTLRMVAGLEEITSGEVYIGDVLVNDIPAKDRDIAMVFQNYALYPHMNVYENMAFGLRLRKYRKEEIDARVQEAAAILGISELLHRKPGELSGGQKQRVAVGRCIVRKPKVFLFDEPLSNLDAKMRVQMRAELSKLHDKLQTTMVYVTHDQVEAMTMGDRIVVMKDGLIQQIADPITLYDSPKNKFVAGFIGTPPMNFFDCAVEDPGSGILLDEGSFKVKVPEDKAQPMNAFAGRTVTLGIRPEDIYNKIYFSGSADNIVKAVAEVVEPMGSEICMYLNTGKNSFIIKTQSHDKTEVSQAVEAVFNMDKCHVFNKETEETIF